MEKFKLEAISFAQTFVALFLFDVAFSLQQVPLDQLVSMKNFNTAFFLGIVAASARSALKVAWQKFMPVKLGGKKN